jgi:hypothetical protein
LIKPNDMVRTPTGRTAHVVGLNPDGSRKLADVATGEIFDMRPEALFLVRAAPIVPWKKRLP